MLSSYFVVHQMHINIIQAASYFPVILWLTERFIRNQRYVNLVPLAIAGGFLCLGGHPQIVMYVLFFGGIYFLFRLVEIDRNKRLKSFLFYFISLGSGLLLASIQLLPLMELMSFGSRNISRDYNFLTFGSLPWKNLATFLSPEFYGTPANNTYIGSPVVDYFYEYPIYCGLIPLTGLLVYQKNSKNRLLIRFFSLLFFLSIILMLGRYTPIYRLVAFFPPFNLTRIPARLGFLATFCLAALTGLKWPLINIKDKKYLDYFIFIFLIADLFYYGYSFNPVIDPKIYQPAGPITSVIKQDKTIFRAQRFNVHQLWRPQGSPDERYQPFTSGWLNGTDKYFNASESLTPNTFTLNSIQTLDGFNQLQFSRFKELMGAPRSKSSLIPYKPTLPILSLLNVKYIVTSQILESHLLQLVKEWSDLKLYRNKFVLPRAFLITRYEVIADPRKLLEAMQSNAFNPVNKVYLEEPPPRFSAVTVNLAARVNISDYRNNQVAIDVQSPQDAFLVLSDAYYPGWRAFLDGQNTKIYRADYTLRGVRIPAGKHKLKFVFEPRSLYWGAAISLVTLLLLTIFGITTIRLKW